MMFDEREHDYKEKMNNMYIEICVTSNKDSNK